MAGELYNKNNWTLQRFESFGCSECFDGLRWAPMGWMWMRMWMRRAYQIVGLRRLMAAVLFSAGQQNQITTTTTTSRPVLIGGSRRTRKQNRFLNSSLPVHQSRLRQQQTLSALFEKTVHEICSHLAANTKQAYLGSIARVRSDELLPIKGPHFEPRKAPATNWRPIARAQTLI